MKQAPLQLQDYWVDFIQVRANTQYDPLVPPDLDLGSIEIKADVWQHLTELDETRGTSWFVRLQIHQAIPEGLNIPYEFALDITGSIAVHPSFTGEQLERSIEVNGPSMLFGAAREIIRAATGRGPHAPIIIPSANFFQRLPTSEKTPALETAASLPDKKTPAKKKSPK